MAATVQYIGYGGVPQRGVLYRFDLEKWADGMHTTPERVLQNNPGLDGTFIASVRREYDQLIDSASNGYFLLDSGEEIRLALQCVYEDCNEIEELL